MPAPIGCRRRRAAGALAAALLAAFAAAPGALAHARVVDTEPAQGTVAASSPAEVRVFFDEPVASAGDAVLEGPSRRDSLRARLAAGGRVLAVPVPSRLADGQYTLRWRIVSDDGHVESGGVAFGVGLRTAAPAAAAATSSTTDLALTAARWLFLSGLLVAAGLAALRPALAGTLPERVRARERRAAAVCLVVLLGLAALGASLELARVPEASSTRFGSVTLVAAAVAAAGAAAAALAIRVPALLGIASLAAVALVPLPAAAGHALSPGRSVWLALPADVMHTAAAAGWIGGLAWLALVPAIRAPLAPPARRFARLAPWLLAAVAVSGALRALAELERPGDLVSTRYGQLLLAKTALLAGVVAVAGFSRRAAAGGSRLRLPVGIELGLLALVVVAVAGLGTATPPRALGGTQPPAVVLAREAGELAVALRARGDELTLTVLDQNGAGVRGLDVELAADGRSTRGVACGAGCYRAELAPRGPLRVRLAHRGSIVFSVPDDPQPARAAALVRASERALGRVTTLRIRERLAADPVHVLVTRYRLQAPDRLAYSGRKAGEAVVIGTRRWDRPPGSARWQLSTQQRLRIPQPDWTSAADPAVLGDTVVAGRDAVLLSFRDPTVPAWFEVAVDRGTSLPLRVRMVAAAHFMDRRYGSFDEPFEIRAPARR